MPIQNSVAAYGPPMHYLNNEASQAEIPECLKELVDYKNSHDYMMFK